MTISEEAEALRNVPLFSRADPIRLKLLAFTSQRKTYPEGTVFFHEGDPADATYLILSGSVEVCLIVRGEITAISNSGEGTLIGEAGVLTNRPPHRDGTRPHRDGGALYPKRGFLGFAGKRPFYRHRRRRHFGRSVIRDDPGATQQPGRKIIPTTSSGDGDHRRYCREYDERK